MILSNSFFFFPCWEYVLILRTKLNSNFEPTPFVLISFHRVISPPPLFSFYFYFPLIRFSPNIFLYTPRKTNLLPRLTFDTPFSSVQLDIIHQTFNARAFSRRPFEYFELFFWKKKIERGNLLLRSQLVGPANRKVAYLYEESCYFIYPCCKK